MRGGTDRDEMANSLRVDVFMRGMHARSRVCKCDGQRLL